MMLTEILTRPSKASVQRLLTLIYTDIFSIAFNIEKFKPTAICSFCYYTGRLVSELLECFEYKFSRGATLKAQVDVVACVLCELIHIRLASFLWDIGKQNNPRCDDAFCGVTSRAFLFAYMNFIEK